MSHTRRSLARSLIILSLVCAIVTISVTQSALGAPFQSAAIDAQGGLPTAQIILKYRADAASRPDVTSAGELNRLSEAAGAPLAYVREMSGDAHVLRLPEARPLAEVQPIADRLAKLPEVEYAVPDRILQPLLTPNDPQYGNQWHYFGAYGIDAPAAWDITTGSSSIVVAVIDTGIRPHADLAGRILPGYDFITDVFVANDGGGRDNDASDPGDWVTTNQCGYPHAAENSSWHGTHVAGTIAANSNNSLGVAGINWSSKILPVRVLGKCGGTNSDIIDAMRWSAGLSVPGVPANPYPAKVLNLSLGGSGACDVAQQAAIDAIVAAGATVVVAAGNDNANAGGYNPASCNNIITVAATDNTGDRAYYSNYGAVVDIAAPGGAQSAANDPNGVLSTLNAGTTVPAADNYIYYQGTSMAAPHVAGIASLLVSLSPSLTPNQVSQIMRGTVKAFPGGSTCNTSICGPGIASAFNSVSVLPRITSYSPTSIPMGGPNTTLVITGANFVSGALVKWNGVNLATTFVNATRVTAVISASLLTGPVAGQVNVTQNHATYGSLTTASRTVLVTSNQALFLPVVLLNPPAPPVPPTLLAISNPSQAGSYSVVWTGSVEATGYTLQEDDNAAFSSPTTVYTGPGTSWNASGKTPGTYYYRAKASNSRGDSGWSVTRSTVVATPSSTLVNGNFESGPTGWTEYSDHGWDLIVTSFPGTITPHGGSWAVWLGGEYDDVSYIQQQVTVPPATPYLGYWHWIASADVCGFDFASVRINGGAVSTYDLCSSVNTGGWVKRVINLGAYAGQSVTLQFRVSTDSSDNSNLFIDDVAFQATAALTLDDADAAPVGLTGAESNARTLR